MPASAAARLRMHSGKTTPYLAVNDHLQVNLLRLPINDRLLLKTNMYTYIYTPCQEKRVYSMCNFNKLKDIFIIFGTNHPETPLY